jgi:hypothetical protein
MSQGQADLFKQFEAPDLESLDVSTRRQVELARGLFTELSRLMKSITLYGATHQSALNFRARFSDTLQQALNERDSLTVEVLTYALVISEQVVYEDAKMEGNFIYKLYTDGVRSLSLRRGVTAGEVDRLLDVLLLDWSDPKLFEEDSITVLWGARFEHISYTVAPRYDEGTEEGEEEVFSLTEALHALNDLLGTSPGAPALAPLEVEADEGRRVELARAAQLNERELLEKLISVAQVAYAGQGRAGRGRALELVDQIAQLFAQKGDISALERFMRQALRVVGPEGREPLLALWNVTLFVQRVMEPLTAPSHPQALSSLACLQLLGAEATPHMTRVLGRVAEAHLPTLARLARAHLPRFAVDVCRSVRAGDLSQATRLITLSYETQDPALSLKVFETAWAHEDRDVRYEAMRALPESIKGARAVVEAIFEGLRDPYSKVRSLAIVALSQARSEEGRARVIAELDGEASASLEPVELGKLYVAAALAGVPAAVFEGRLGGGLGGLLGRGKGQRAAALLGFACASTDPERAAGAVALLEREAGRVMGGAPEKEAARWGVAYLQAAPKAREQAAYELFYRGVLTPPPPSPPQGR